MKLTRFGETNRNIKVCNNDSEKSRYKKKYDPAYIYDLPYKALVSNTNSMSEKYDKNQVIDESSWPHCRYGEDGSGIYGRLYLKKNLLRVGRLFCVWILEGYKSVRTCIATIYITKRNRVGQMPIHDTDKVW